MFNLERYQSGSEDRLSDLLPWALLVAPGVVEQKDGLLQKTLAFRGPDLASSTRSGLVSVVAQVNNALRRFGEGWTFFFEARRNFALGYPASKFPDSLSQRIDDERHKNFEQEGAHFDSCYYLTLVYAPLTKHQSFLKTLFLGQPSEEENLAERLNYFRDELSRLLALLTRVFPEAFELNDEQTLCYLHSCVSTKQHRICVPETPMFLDAILTDQDVEHGLETRLGDNFLRTLSVRGFPGQTYPGILDALNELQCEYRWVSRYIAFSKEQARQELGRYRKRWYAKRKGFGSMVMETATQTESALGNSDAARKSEDADQALQELEEDWVSFGQFTATITVWGQSRQEADDKVKRVEAVINSKGFTTYLEHLGSSEAWLGSLPGHVYANVHRPIVSSLNLAHLLPLSAVWSGAEGNTHLKGPFHFFDQNAR